MEPDKKALKDAEKSDQRHGEQTVQVNDAYAGGGPPPDDDSNAEDEQHPTGG
jgi:hypothetical protein